MPISIFLMSHNSSKRFRLDTSELKSSTLFLSGLMCLAEAEFLKDFDMLPLDLVLVDLESWRDKVFRVVSSLLEFTSRFCSFLDRIDPGFLELPLPQDVRLTFRGEPLGEDLSSWAVMLVTVVNSLLLVCGVLPGPVTGFSPALVTIGEDWDLVTFPLPRVGVEPERLPELVSWVDRTGEFSGLLPRRPSFRVLDRILRN